MFNTEETLGARMPETDDGPDLSAKQIDGAILYRDHAKGSARAA